MQPSPSRHLGKKLQRLRMPNAAIKVPQTASRSNQDGMAARCALAQDILPDELPHGRPVVLRYSVKEIERAFHRI